MALIDEVRAADAAGVVGTGMVSSPVKAAKAPKPVSGGKKDKPKDAPKAEPKKVDPPKDTPKDEPKVEPTSKPGFDLVEDEPMPETRRAGGRESVYPWATMDVGKAFFVPGGKLTTFSAGCNKTGKKLSRKFICREREREGVKGIMVWRKE